jgi:hypothetical protein
MGYNGFSAVFSDFSVPKIPSFYAVHHLPKHLLNSRREMMKINHESGQLAAAEQQVEHHLISGCTKT